MMRFRISKMFYRRGDDSEGLRCWRLCEGTEGFVHCQEEISLMASNSCIPFP